MPLQWAPVQKTNGLAKSTACTGTTYYYAVVEASATEIRLASRRDRFAPFLIGMLGITSLSEKSSKEDALLWHLAWLKETPEVELYDDTSRDGAHELG